jgi:cell shape-determining protein MreC
VLIGRVERIKKVRKNNSQTLILRSATNFRNLMYVYVVENALLNERHQLEDSARIDFRPKNSRP